MGSLIWATPFYCPLLKKMPFWVHFGFIWVHGIRNGGDRKSDGHNVQVKNQDDLASELEMSKKQMSRFKSLTDLIPELQDAVQSG